MKQTKRTKHGCARCGRGFKSQAGLRQHDTKAHPYVAPPRPPEPKKTIEVAPDYLEDHNLLGGHRLNIGDVVWIGRKAVITKLTKTEGSRDLSVTVRITRRWWSAEEISKL